MSFDRRQYQIDYRNRKRELLWNYLITHVCVDCAESDPVVLEFDHLPGFVKIREVAMMVSSGTWSWATIEAEIAKCEVVCANCHKRRTSKRGNHFKEAFKNGLSSTG
jgi:hypothetical protein